MTAVNRTGVTSGRIGLAAIVASVTLTFVVALAGPSVMEPALPGAPGQPPWAVPLRLSPYLAVGLTAAALAAGTAGLGLCLRALRRGWTVPPWTVLAAGITAAAVLALVPPFGSSDHLSYAAYGRMVVTGHDPYTTTPAALAGLGDPVARAVQDWRASPSVYGSLASAGQALASWIGGTSVRLTVFVLSLLNVAAFAGTGLLLHRLTRDRPARQLRAGLLWTFNPLLLQVLVAGAHVDSQAIVFGVAAIALAAFGLSLDTGRDARAGGPGRRLGRRQFAVCAAAGAVAGMGFAVKLTMALIPAGLVVAAVLACRSRHGKPAGTTGPQWLRGLTSRHTPALAAGGITTGFAVAAAVAFIPWGLGSLQPALRAGGYVSVGSPWRTVRLLHFVIGEAAADDVVKAGAIIMMAVLVALFARPLLRLSGRLVASGRGTGPGAGAGPAGGDDPAGGSGPGMADLAGLAAAGAFVFAFAWLVAWPYVLPWYDGLAWALLALLPWVAVTGGAGRIWAALDWLVLARTAALSFGYLPARHAGIVMPPSLDWLQSVVRTGVTPAILFAVTVLLASMLWPRRARATRGERGEPA